MKEYVLYAIVQADDSQEVVIGHSKLFHSEQEAITQHESTSYRCAIGQKIIRLSSLVPKVPEADVLALINQVEALQRELAAVRESASRDFDSGRRDGLQMAKEALENLVKCHM